MQTLNHFLDEATRSFGPLPALLTKQRYRTEVWSYDELLRHSGQVTSWLQGRGVAREDRVVLWAPNNPWWIAAYFGALRLGAIVVPLDLRSGPDFVTRVLEQTEPALILHAGVSLEGLTMRGASAPLQSLAELPPGEAHTLRAEVGPDDIAEIMFTSGTTGDPKGVILTHRNVLSDVEAVNRVLPSGPELRLLSILPLSHMFEQTVGLLLPLHGGANIYYPMTRQSTTIFRDIKDQGITTMLLVPQALQLFMDAIEPEVARQGKERQFRRLQALAERLPMRARRILFHSVHAQLGGKLQFVVTGGAPLPPGLAEKWELLGIAVYEGYGATEAAPVLTATPPRDVTRGTVGRPVPGVSIRLSEDGEILARGPNITPGYWDNAAATEAAFLDAWDRTGDLGDLDAQGNLSLHGRKRDLIVLSNGQNVYPEDVEAALVQSSVVNDAIVFGLPTAAGAEVHAVLLPTEPSLDPGEAVRAANARLAPHQRITGFTIWPDADFPRTHTLKVKRREVLKTVLELRAGEVGQSPTTAPEAPVSSPLQGLLQQATGTITAELQPERTLQEIGLDSLGRVELLAAIEAELGIYLEESQVGPEMTIAELETLIGRKESSARPTFARWTLSLPTRLARNALQGPAFALLNVIAPACVSGTDALADITPPVLFIANHTSHLDTPTVLQALPRRWRRSLTVAAAADYFFTRPWLGGSTALLFNAFPFSREDAVRATLEHCAWLFDHGWSILLYPEGTRSTTGEIGPFKPGVGLLAVELGTPVVPIYLTGLHAVLPKGRTIPHRGEVSVRFGETLQFAPSTSYDVAAAQIEKALHDLERGD